MRQQAVFALSQLPDDRATTALIALVEDRGVTEGDRRRAIFWLAQSEDDRALAYLDRIVDD